MKKTVNIIGSCVSRDCFNSKFVPEHSAYFTVNTYLPRIAVPALMTPGVTYDDEILAGEKGAWYYECYYKAYRKYFLSLLAGSQADFLLLDFYTDAYLGVREYDGQLITYMRNQRWTGSIDRSRLGRRFHSCRNVSAYRKLWRKYFDDFVQFLAAYCPDTCVVLNGIKGSDRILDSDVRQLPEVDLGAVNSFWQELDDYALQKYPEIVYLRYDREYRLDPAYPFGGLAMEFVHFERGYYEDFFAKLRTVSEERGKERQKNLSAVNLVRNGAFAQGLMGWFYRDSCWRVEKTEGHFWAVCGGADGQARDTWCWSDAIEVNGDSRIRYTLSFVCRAGRDVQEPDACLVKVREFKNARDREPGDALKEYRVNYLEQPYTFVPETKYVRIGLKAAVGEGGILFTDISLVRGEKAAAIWQETEILWSVLPGGPMKMPGF